MRFAVVPIPSDVVLALQAIKRDSGLAKFFATARPEFAVPMMQNESVVDWQYIAMNSIDSGRQNVGPTSKSAVRRFLRFLRVLK